MQFRRLLGLKTRIFLVLRVHIFVVHFFLLLLEKPTFKDRCILALLLKYSLILINDVSSLKTLNKVFSLKHMSRIIFRRESFHRHCQDILIRLSANMSLFMRVRAGISVGCIAVISLV